VEKIEFILTECINDIKSGRATLAECLERYPSQRRELEPLLELALNIQKPPEIKLDSRYKQEAKARLLQQIARPKVKPSRSFSDILSLGIPRRLAPVRMAVSIIVIIIVLSLLGGGTAYASQDSLPGEILYPVKTATEDTRLFLAGDSAAKTDLNLQFARKRLEEMDKLASGNRQGTELAVTGYCKNLEAAAGLVRSITDDATLTSELDKVLAQIASQLTYCDGLADVHPDYQGQANEAAEISIRTQLNLLQILEEHDIVQAAQINLNTMQNRLRRAQVKSDANQFQAVEEALAQYEQFSTFGEALLQLAQGDNALEIAGLSEDVLSVCLANLDSIAQKTPGQYQSVIQTHRQSALRFQSQAHQQRQRQGNPGGGNGPGNGQGSGQGNGQGSGQENDQTSSQPGGQESSGLTGQANGQDVDIESSPETSSSVSPVDNGQGQGTSSGGDGGQGNSQNTGQESNPGTGGGNSSPGDGGQGQSPSNEDGTGSGHQNGG
jgi:hypothetical protein